MLYLVSAMCVLVVVVGYLVLEGSVVIYLVCRSGGIGRYKQHHDETERSTLSRRGGGDYLMWVCGSGGRIKQ